MPLLKKWRFLDLGTQNIFLNMAIDEALLNSLIHGHSTLSTLRFYTWKAPSLSIGRFQKIAGRLDLPKCQELGLEMVRRPSGGRAVLHGGDLTYSLVFAEDDLIIPKGILPSYQLISQALQKGLAKVGVSTTSSKGRQMNDSPLCFSHVSKFELLIQGKKIMGHAQRREKGFVLQQGSISKEKSTIPMTQLFPSIKTNFTEAHAVKAPSLQEKTVGKNQSLTSLEELLAAPIPLEDLKEALRQGFEETMNISFIYGPLSDWESQEADRLVREKYSLEKWNKEGR